MWQIAKKFMQANLVMLNTLAEVLGGAFVVAEVQRIIDGEPEMAVYNLDNIFYGLAISTLAAVPAAITLWQSFNDTKYASLENVSESHNLVPKSSSQPIILKALQESKNLVFKGVPFGLLDFGGCYIFLNKLTPHHQVNLSLSCAAAFASSWSNYRLTSQHENNHRSWWQLVCHKKIMPLIGTLLIAALTLCGHLFQTFLDLEIFDDSIDAETDPHENNFWLEEGLSLSVAALVTALEGYAKLSASFYHQKNVSMLSRSLMLVCSLIHLLLPAVGAIRVAEFSYELIYEASFLPNCYLGLRIGFLCSAAALFGFPNARGYYHMHVENLDNSLEKANTLFFKGEKKTAAHIPKQIAICDNRSLTQH